MSRSTNMQLIKYLREFSLHPENAKELRGLILQLAIQGKLTSNWRREHPDVEPASFLLDRIGKEKINLVREKKTRKEKSLPPISEEEMSYQLPKGWEWCRLTDISVYIQRGKSPKYSEIKKIPVIAQKCIQWKGFEMYKAKFIDPNTIVKYGPERILKSDDLLWNSTGRGSLGRIGIYNENYNEYELAVADSHVTVIRVDKNNCIADYIFKYLSSPLIQNNIENRASGSTNQIELNTGTVKETVLALPPKKEQKAIIKVVEQLFVEVEQLEELTKQRIQLKLDFVTSALQELTIGDTQKEWTCLQQHFSTFFSEKQNIEKLRGGILQLAMQGKLTKSWRKQRLLIREEVEDASFLIERIKSKKEKLVKEKKIRKEKPLPQITKDDIPYELPKGWVWCRMLDFCYLITDGAHHTPRYVDSGVPFLSVKNLSKGILDFSDTKFIELNTHQDLIKRCNPEYGDILLTKIGTTGIAKVIDTRKDFSIFVSVALLKIAKDELFPKFIEHCINSPLIKKQSSDGTEGVGNKNLVLRKIKAFLIPLPPFEEQQAIVQKVNALMSLCDGLEQQIIMSEANQENWMKSALREVFAPKETKDGLINSLLPDLDSLHKVANLQQAMIVQKTELGLGSGRGKVYLQKTSANLKSIKKVDIPYEFKKSHHGEFSWQLSEDLDKNPYLHKVTTDYGEIFEVKASKQQEVLKALNTPANASFVQAVDELINVYQNRLISGATDRVELLNTVCRAVKDTKSTIGNTIYSYMRNWEIEQKGYDTKADKFTQSEVFAIIQLIVQLGWEKELMNDKK